jgi:hypothetical protein
MTGRLTPAEIRALLLAIAWPGGPEPSALVSALQKLTTHLATPWPRPPR